jgi:hypothetical protein
MDILSKFVLTKHLHFVDAMIEFICEMASLLQLSPLDEHMISNLLLLRACLGSRGLHFRVHTNKVWLNQKQ